MKLSDKIILVHKGAMGDFLQTWPAIAGLRRWTPGTVILWAGAPAFSPWVEPLGIQCCPPRLRHSLDTFYSSSSIPAALREYQILWFGLEANPLLPKDEQLLFLQGIVEGLKRPPREIYLSFLTSRGMPSRNWTLDWRELFPDAAAREKGPVLLFPGSGHMKKCWPLVQFFALADWLESLGAHPLFVLGPAEQERGVEVSRFPVIRPDDVQHLHSLVRQASFVVGNDCGPMHLAGFQKIPGVALFGPTCAKRWAPPGLNILQADVPCAPCTRTGVIECEKPACMESIRLGQVQEKIGRLMNFSP